MATWLKNKKQKKPDFETYLRPKKNVQGRGSSALVLILKSHLRTGLKVFKRFHGLQKWDIELRWVYPLTQQGTLASTF